MLPADNVVYVLMIVFAWSPFLLIGLVGLWILVRLLRGSREMEDADDIVRGRPSKLVLPQRSSKVGIGAKPKPPVNPQRK